MKLAIAIAAVAAILSCIGAFARLTQEAAALPPPDCRAAVCLA